MKSRFALSLSLALALSLAACIENPGVDPGLGGRKSGAETTWISATFREGNFLNLRMQRDSGRTSLRVVNAGLGSIDSAAFLLQLIEVSSTFNPYQAGLYPPAAFEYYGKVGRLAPGEAADFGVIDSVNARDSLSYPKYGDYQAVALVLRASENGTVKGNPFGGVFSGAHRGVDTGGKSLQGPVRGIITADGTFRFAVFQAGNSPLGFLHGTVNDTGGLGGDFWLTRNNSGKSGRFYTKPDGFGGSFAFRDTLGGWLDSLVLDYQAFQPR